MTSKDTEEAHGKEINCLRRNARTHCDGSKSSVRIREHVQVDDIEKQQK